MRHLGLCPKHGLEDRFNLHREYSARLISINFLIGEGNYLDKCRDSFRKHGVCDRCSPGMLGKSIVEKTIVEKHMDAF